MLAPAASRTKVEEVVPVHATCEEALPAVGVGLHVPEGTRGGELVYELPLEADGRALVYAANVNFEEILDVRVTSESLREEV